MFIVDTPVTLHDLLYLLVVTCFYENHSTTPNHRSDVSEEIQRICNQFPEILSPAAKTAKWNFDLFASLLLSLYPKLTFSELLNGLDDPLFTIPHREGFFFLYSLYLHLSNMPLPASLLYAQWKNTPQQLQFLNNLLAIDPGAFVQTSPQVVCGVLWC